MLRIYNHLEIYIPRSLNICIYMLSRTRSWNKRAQWAAAASVFLLFLQGISILGSKHFRVQTLPIYKKVLINMHGPSVFVESNPNQTPQDFTENHCNNASLLLRSWWFLSTAHVARSVISKAQALLLWALPPHGGCALNRWKTVIVLSGFQQFKLTKKGELRNPARSESDWSYTNCPQKKTKGLDPKKDLHWKKGKSLKRRLVFKRRFA